MDRNAPQGGQMGLGFGDTAATDRLFFAVFPDRDAASKLAELAQRLRAQHGLRGKALRTDRFHVTLLHLGDFPGDIWPRIAATAAEAAAQVRLAPFRIAFDSASSFATRRRDRPFVLRSENRSEGLHALYARLGEALRRSGSGIRAEREFVPHVTLLYDERTVAPAPVEAVSWEVGEFVLVRSLLGKTQHERLGEWPLRIESAARPPN